MTDPGSSQLRTSLKQDLSSSRSQGEARDEGQDPTQLPEASTVIRQRPTEGPVAEQPTVVSNRPTMDALATPAPIKTNELGRFLEGEVLEHFRLDEFIGGGGMGAVFRAHDMKLSRTVAVKVLSQTQSAADDIRRRFQLEAQSAARLDHENIARVYYVGEHKGWNFIVFEYIDGVNIRDLVGRRGPLALSDAISYTLQVAEALQHASQRDLVHRDIKPSNVLITDSGRAKLVDMGLARLHHVEAGQEDLTASGVTLGTFDYISPEQARDPRNADARSDIYSLGCTLFFMLVGRPPFPDGTVLQKLLSHTSDAPPDIRQYRRDLPAEVAALTQKMLAKRPDGRHQKPSELIGELLLLNDRLGLGAARHGGTVWVTPGEQRLSAWERHLPWIVPIVLLIGIVFGVNYLSQVPDVKLGGPSDAQGSTTANQASTQTNKLSPAGAKPSATQGGRDGNRDDQQHDPETTTGGKGEDMIHPEDVEAPIDRPTISSEAEKSESHDATTSPPDLLTSPTSSALEPVDHPRAPSSAGPNESREVLANHRREENIVLMPRVLVVGESIESSGEATFPTVHAALTYLGNHRGQAEQVEAIELRFTGQQIELPLVSTAPNVVIRAGQGYSPILVFRPEEYHQPSMITVAGGTLIMDRVHLELELPPDPVDNWSLFSCRQASHLRLSQSSLTVRNDADGRKSYHSDVAFFHIEPTLPSIRNGKTSSPTNSLVIELHNCVARGEATLLWSGEALPLDFVWRNGFLITTERLLRTGGVPMPEQEINVRLQLEHVTAVMDRGMCLIASDGSNPNLPRVDIECHDSVLMPLPMSPLVEHRSSFTPEALQKKFSFRGKRTVFLTVADGTAGQVYWRVTDPKTDTQPIGLGFRQWSHHWSGAEHHWQEAHVASAVLPSADRPAHELTVRDYTWSQLFSSGDVHGYLGSEGFLEPDLPQFPPEDDHNEKPPAPAPNK